jgi:endonuclease III
MHADARAEKLIESARIAIEAHGGDLDAVIRESQAAGRRALKKYPGIGAPGADKILLFRGVAPSLALESNGLRVLVRLGFGREDKSYDKTYRSVQEAAAPEIGEDLARLEALHLFLRAHGSAVCKRSKPLCGSCVFAGDCPSADG